MRSLGRFALYSARWITGLRLLIAVAVFAVGGAVAPRAVFAQGADPASQDIITPHITDSYEIEVPWVNARWAKEVCLGHHEANGECGPLWGPVTIGGNEVTLFGKPVNLSPTKHVVMLLLAATIATVVLVGAAGAQRRHANEAGHTKGFTGGIEALVLYIRNEVILPNVGHHGEAYVPFALTLFFFILLANLLGLLPYFSTATGNISVTATLAVITFIVVEIAGIKTQGIGYLNTIFYWNKDLPMVMRILMFPLMSIVEIVGKLTKPFALAIRLFANMTAGHIVVLALIGLIFTFRSIASGAPLLMAIAIMVLELFVALLQAYIFTLLSSVFIGLIREGGH
jgi:F-type H+-transporting ATPase subunit a